MNKAIKEKYEKALLATANTEKKTLKDFEEIANSTLQMVYKVNGLLDK